MKFCYICYHNGGEKKVPAVAVCNESGKPVCQQHADWCLREGHGTSELEEE